jgi:hypothetical protein
VLCRRRQAVKTGSRKGEMLTAAGGWHSAGGWLLVVRVFRLVNLGCLLLSLTKRTREKIFPVRRNMVREEEG